MNIKTIEIILGVEGFRIGPPNDPGRRVEDVLLSFCSFSVFRSVPCPLCAHLLPGMG